MHAGQSKTANIYLATEIERRYGSQGVHAWAVHPGAPQAVMSRDALEKTTALPCCCICHVLQSTDSLCISGGIMSGLVRHLDMNLVGAMTTPKMKEQIKNPEQVWAAVLGSICLLLAWSSAAAAATSQVSAAADPACAWSGSVLVSLGSTGSGAGRQGRQVRASEPGLSVRWL